MSPNDQYIDHSDELLLNEGTPASAKTDFKELPTTSKEKFEAHSEEMEATMGSNRVSDYEILEEICDKLSLIKGWYV